MSVSDAVLESVIIFLQKMASVLPTSFGALTIEQFNGYLTSAQEILLYSYTRIGSLVPISLILTLIVIIFSAEILLFSFRIIKFVINIVRGSGA